MKKFFKYCLRAIGCFTAFIILYLLAAVCLSLIPVGAETGQPKELAIYIKTNGVHTDIVVPVVTSLIDWTKEIKLADTHLADTSGISYLAMGWGDKGFYLDTPTWSDLKFGTAFKAAFGLNTTAMHTTFYRELKESKFCRKIMISNAQYSRLVKYVSASFRQDSAAHVEKIITSANYNDADAFYEANGRYHLFCTCNTWTNNVLKICGQKACLWTPFDAGIFYQYR